MDQLAFDLEGLATATRQVRHLYENRTNVAHRLPRGKRASCNGNQPHSRTTTVIRRRFSKIRNKIVSSDEYYFVDV
ncbi:hypothetical protein P4V41_04485 [Fictibacillus nanhaiensis]|uniref:hypothetical protein n=1 Tax=Fictibacillus nanhaiensis TaxID=742169 RepID=UPI002E251044|nr:hypothetical protein [Fictibacillus nanhaiensis]